MKLVIYTRLTTCSKRAMLKVKGKHGRYTDHFPQKRLIDRLVHKLGMPEAEVIEQYFKEREYLLKTLS